MSKNLSMGVINLTPNSFSNNYNHIDPENIKKLFNMACSDFDIIDLGAESTAPFNSKVTQDIEVERFEKYFFPILKSLPDSSLTLSIDTYKVDVFIHVYHTIKKYWPKASIIFNDVSGVVDADLISVLDSDMDFTYIYSHNLIEQREDTLNHMSFVDPSAQYLENIKNYFQEGLKTLKNFNKEIIIDPCFGFSKSREQNQILLKNFHKIFGNLMLDYKVLIGISRKSFLRFPKDLDPKLVKNQKLLDSIASLIYKNLLALENSENLIFRVHDKDALSAVNFFNNHFEIAT